MHPERNIPAVENITFPFIGTMEKGKYAFRVECFANRGCCNGFRAEVEAQGKTYLFDYNMPMRTAQKVDVATVLFDGNCFHVSPKLTHSESRREKWGVSTGNFVPVSIITHSPNYWETEKEPVGHRHVFFILKDCINDEFPNGFYNEFLRNELMPHRKVFEMLGTKARVEPMDNQLSGIGFSTTKRNDIFVRVKGKTNRVVKVKF